MQNNDNAAYDYSRFEQQPLKKPDIKEVAIKKRAPKRASVFKTIVYLTIAIAMVSSLLYCKALQVELDAENTAIQKEINAANAENTRLQVELESKLSLKKIEEIAVEQLGLEKIDDLKIEYINFNEYDKAEVLAEKGFFENLLDSVKGFFS